MSTASLRARYLGDTVATASPQQVLVMLYDRLALDLERAQKAVAAGEREAANAELQHAQDIVLELLSSLQVDAWEGGPRLAALYNWLITELVQANIKMDTNRISACRQGVEPLRDAGREAGAPPAGRRGGPPQRWQAVRHDQRPAGRHRRGRDPHGELAGGARRAGGPGPRGRGDDGTGARRGDRRLGTADGGLGAAVEPRPSAGRSPGTSGPAATAPARRRRGPRRAHHA